MLRLTERVQTPFRASAGTMVDGAYWGWSQMLERNAVLVAVSNAFGVLVVMLVGDPAHGAQDGPFTRGGPTAASRFGPVKREVVGWMRCFSRDRSQALGQRPLHPRRTLSQRPSGTPPPTQ